MMNPVSLRLSVSVVLALVSIDAALAKPRLHILRTSPAAGRSAPLDISADGRVIVGSFIDTNSLTQAFRQVGLHKPKDIRMNLPVESNVAATSADGSVVLGNTYSAAGFTRSYRWTQETGPVDLSSNPDLVLYAYGLSGDGRVAVGEYESISRINYHRLPFYWSVETGVQLLCTPFEGTAFAASYDGTVVVGYITSTNGTFNGACRWVEQGEPELLAPSYSNSYASAVTPDGSLVVGNVNEADGGTRAFRWIAYYGLEWIDTGPSLHSFSTWDQSADGTRIVGDARTADNDVVGVMWSQENGLQDLNELFVSLLPQGWKLLTGTAISADGRWIVSGLGNSNGEFKGCIIDTGRVRKR